MIIRAVPHESAAADLESAARALFASLHDAQPAGIAYYSLREQDGNYLIVLQIEDGLENPLLAMPEFQAFQAGTARWLAEPSRPAPGQVIGAYGVLVG